MVEILMSFLGPELYLLGGSALAAFVAFLYGKNSGKNRERDRQAAKQLKERDIIDGQISELRDIEHDDVPDLDSEFVQNDPRNRDRKGK